VLKSLDGPLEDTAPGEEADHTARSADFSHGFGQIMAPRDAYPILKAGHELGIGMGSAESGGDAAPDEWMRALGSLPLMHQPGEKWIYNTGSDVLGVLIARASGQAFETFCANVCSSRSA